MRGMTTTNRAAYPWRKVIIARDARGPSHTAGAFTRYLELSCGHTLARKASQGMPAKVRCTLCKPEPKS